MAYRNRWLLWLATLIILSIFLIAAGRVPGSRIFLPMIAREWQLTPTPTRTQTPTSTSTPYYAVTFTENISITSIDGSDPACRVGNGCPLFAIQVVNWGNRSVQYWLTKQQTLPQGWGAFFCWGDDCFFGNASFPRVLAVGRREILTINFRVPPHVVDGTRAVVDVRGYWSCESCPDPVIHQPYAQTFTVLVIVPTPTPSSTSTATPTPTFTLTPTPTGTPTPTATVTATPASS